MILVATKNEALVKALNAYGYNAVQAKDAEEFKILLNTHKFDFVLTTENFSSNYIYDVVNTFKEHEKDKDMVWIVTVSSPTYSDLRALVDAGIKEIIAMDGSSCTLAQVRNWIEKTHVFTEEDPNRYIKKKRTESEKNKEIPKRGCEEEYQIYMPIYTEDFLETQYGIKLNGDEQLLLTTLKMIRDLIPKNEYESDKLYYHIATNINGNGKRILRKLANTQYENPRTELIINELVSWFLNDYYSIPSRLHEWTKTFDNCCNLRSAIEMEYFKKLFVKSKPLDQQEEKEITIEDLPKL